MFRKRIGLAAALAACMGILGAGIVTYAENPDSSAEMAVIEAEGTEDDLITELGGEPVSGEERTIQEIAKTVMPAMVSITNTSVKQVQDYYNGFDGDLFDFFGFGDFYGYGGRSGNRQPQTRESVSMGTGIIIGETDDLLLIATNEHVVSDANELSVGFVDETAAPAEISGGDEAHDLAIVQVEKSGLEEGTLDAISIIPVGSSSELEVGEQVIAIGNALGYGQSVSAGIVSALNRSITSQNELSGTITKTEGMIQTDASINPGNSGGALLNMKGELIGINSAKYADTMVEGMGYAIPTDTALPILLDLANGKQATLSTNIDGSVRLGVTVTTITEEFKESYPNLPDGVYVMEVETGTPAFNAGVKQGDIITAIDGTELKTVEELQQALKNYSAGDSATLSISRQGSGSFGDEGFETGKVTVTFSTSEKKMSVTE